MGPMKTGWGLRGLALLGMVVGLAGTSGMIFLLNRAIDAALFKASETATSINVAKAPPKPPPIKKTRPKKRRTTRSRRAQAPLPEIDQTLSGIDFALSEFSWLDDEPLASQLLEEAKDLIMTTGTVDKKPVPLNQPPMPYPEVARRRGIEGYVALNVLVNVKGRVEKSQILESEPPGVFEETALRVAEQWRFSPAEYRGQKVRVWSKRTIRFSLN